MSWQDDYIRWNEFEDLEPHLRKQLDEIAENENALEEAFHKPLSFGTGGMRGELGPGTNRMNLYTVRKAAEGLAKYIENQGEEAKQNGLVVAHDSRHMSPEFSLETAKVMGAHGIKTYLFTSLRPTPELSFAVRHLGTAAGVVVTASHNPPEYNGFKVYNEDGGQVPPAQAEEIVELVNAVENELAIDVLEKEELEKQELLKWIDEEVDQAYLEKLQTISLNPEVIEQQANKLKIVFTPLHGTALNPVVNGLEKLGFKQVTVVDEQAKPDPEFSTVASPNPEEHQAFTMAIEYGKKVDADILIGTDPDADRLGVAVKGDDGEYTVLTGNQLGGLMLDYILSNTPYLPENGIMIKTIVTSELGRAVADHYGVETLDTLTGFKFIGEKIREFEQSGKHQFLFGYEESYGYLIRDFARDKDAVQSALMASEMAAYWKSKGKTLFDALEMIYERQGYYLEDLKSLTLKGISGTEQIEGIMNDFRERPLEKVGDISVVAVEDYASSERTHLADGSTDEIDLPKSNVVKFLLEDDCWCCLRPSGTEPKIKFYFGVRGDNRRSAEDRLDMVKNAVMSRVDKLIK
ncbi:phospho-sugar mutase [Salinibacillus xinjiangensis]|uniref:Phosphoglucomutase n=1 Tax=Salinibacillus xinjiangensis TaxID=1229268 RepID=A0A6G1X1Q5_9BACI|nr:phospho-sugar mutase [Salinibacillus xinjiangensis]MRG84815.1 phospho-sugar mutase [Salinibacillus xinjiangensis]